MNAIDTNILIYSVDSSDGVKRRKAVELIQTLPEDETVIPWQVACETAAVLRSLIISGRFQGDYAETLTALRTCFPLPIPTSSTLDRSLLIHARDQISVWDSLLIAACADAGVTTLYTEDMQGKPVIDGVKFVNPFQ